MKISATQTGFALYKEADVIGRCGVTPTPKGADITALSVLPQWRRKGARPGQIPADLLTNVWLCSTRCTVP